MQLCFHFENKDRDQFSGAAIDLDLYRLPAKATGVTHLHMIDLSDARHRWQDELLPLTVYDSFAEFEAAAPEKLILLETSQRLGELRKRDAKPFHSYNRTRKGGIYCVGPSSGWDAQQFGDHVATSLPLVNESALHSAVAFGVICGLLLQEKNSTEPATRVKPTR